MATTFSISVFPTECLKPTVRFAKTTRGLWETCEQTTVSSQTGLLIQVLDGEHGSE